MVARIFCIISLCFFVGCKARMDSAQIADRNNPSSYQVDFEALIDKHQTINDLIGSLPQDLRRNFTMMHHSGSLHSATTNYQAPRVLMYGKDASTLFAFDASSDFVEVIQYDADSGIHEFFSVKEVNAGKQASRLEIDRDRYLRPTRTYLQ